MTETYRAALVGCSRMGAFIDNEVRSSKSIVLPYSPATRSVRPQASYPAAWE